MDSVKMAEKNPPLWAVIMAGGSGTRFWPVSREGRPKQFLPPGGGLPKSPRPKSARKSIQKKSGKKSGDSLLSQTVERLSGLVPPKRILVIGAAGHRKLILEALPQMPVRNVILEPEGRNTAPCLGLAAQIIEGREPGAVMAAFPADHHIARPNVLRRLVRTAARLAAAQDAIVTLGMPPTGPDTGYGYIQRGERLKIPGRTGAYAVRRFTEKPTLSRAKRFVASGNYYWNGGIFIWRAARAIEEIRRRLPRTASSLARAADALRKRQQAAFARAFKACESISIDYAVMERAHGLIVLPADMGWSDMGSWPALPGVLSTDEAGNLWVCPADTHVHCEKARGLLVRSTKPLIAALGVEDLIVIETDDVLLLCRPDDAQAVGGLTKQLKKKGLSEFL
jgi:mannose-1-phosphate guanylyltransferase